MCVCLNFHLSHIIPFISSHPKPQCQFMSNFKRRHQPYRRGGGGGGGRGRGRHPGNRFENSNTKSVDPQTAVLKQLTAMIAKMGDLESCADSASGMGLLGGSGGGDSTINSRGIVQAVARNIQDLVVVLCSAQNAPMFLKFDAPKIGGDQQNQNQDGEASALALTTTGGDSPIKAEYEAGALATLVTSCAATLPLQSPSYVGLTLGIEEHAPGAGDDTAGVSYKGFAQRCISMASRRLGDDLDKVCGVVSLVKKEHNSTEGDQQKKLATDEYVQAFMRSKMLLRYFAVLARTGIISAMNVDVGGLDNDNDGNSSLLTLGGILQALTDGACRAKNFHDGTKAAKTSWTNASTLLAALVLCTIPYSMQVLSKEIVDDLLSKIDGAVEGYESPFKPGVGISSILLEKAQFEDFVVGNADDEDEESDDDEDDDDAGEGSPVCADTFQDLIRTVRKVVESYYANDTTLPSRFALLSDAPWSCLEGKEEEFAPMEGDTEEEILRRKNASKILSYSGEGLLISIANCQLFRLLRNDDMEMDGLPITLHCPSTEGIIFGRLSIFDPPPDDDDEDEEDSARDPNVDAYVKNFTLVDRFFLSDSIRDCLICHRATVSDTGAEQGSAKEVAEQIWAVSHLFLTSQTDNSDINMDDASKGVECGIVETILSLVVQCTRGIESASPASHIYLCRVLIELTKSQPTRIPQSLAFAVSDLFNDFIPSFSPIAKENLSSWFAYHLTNTDYQWPHSYWSAWAPYAVDGMKEKRNSRGEFITRAIKTMASFVGSPETIVAECLPKNSNLSGYIVGGKIDSNVETKASSFLSAVESVEKDIKERIWKNNDEPEDVQEYMIGDEVSEIMQGSMDDDIESSTAEDPDKIWWRAGLIIRVILSPARENEQNLRRIVQDCTANIAMDDDDQEDLLNVDIVADVTDFLMRYKPVLLACLAKDIKIHDENLDLRGVSKKIESEMVLMGEEYILSQCQKVAGFSTSILTSCLEVLVKQKIVSAKGVLQWIFSSEDEKRIEALASHGWWTFASLAVRLAIDDFVSDRITLMESDGGDISMIIDTGGDGEGGNAGTPSARRIKKVTDFISPLLGFASDRVHALLRPSQDDKNLTHFEADLKEGLKFLIRSITSYTILTLTEDETVKKTAENPALEVETWVAKCSFDEKLLAALS